MVKKWFLAGVLGLLVLTGYTCLKLSILPKPALSGYLIQRGQVDNFGLNIKTYQNSNLISSDYTSLNGYFQIPRLSPGVYELYFFNQQYYLGKLNLLHLDKPQKIKFYSADKYYHPLFFIETIGFCIVLILLILSGSVLFRLRGGALALNIFLMGLSIALFNGIDFIQAILAVNSRELLAANIFPLKHIGLTWFGFCFINSLFLFFAPAATAKHRYFPALFLGAVLEAGIVLSWMFCGSDQCFNQLWPFSFEQLRLFIILQLGFCLLYGLFWLLRRKNQAQDPLQKNRLQVILMGWLGFFAVLLLFIFIPVIFGQGREYFPGQFNLTASVAGLLLFFVLTYALTNTKIISFQQLLNRSVTYFIFSFILILVYSLLIVYLDKRLIRFNSYLLNAYIMVFFILLAVPLKNKLQQLIDRIFFGDFLKQRRTLLALAAKLPGILDRKKLIVLLKKNLSQELKASRTEIVLIRPPAKLGPKYLLPGQQQYLDLKKNYSWLDLALPLQDKKLFGYILLGSKTNLLGYTESELELLQAVAAQALISLQNIALTEEFLAGQKAVERSGRLAALGTMTAGLAHELKNPLMAINNLVALYPQRFKEKSFQENFLKIVPRQIERLNALLNNMLNFSKPSAEKHKALNLAEVIRRSVSLLSSQAHKQGVVIKLILNQKKTIKGDEKALEQAFLNLGLNALEAMPKGGILTINLSHKSGLTQVTFADTGQGIAKKDLNKIFDPFFTTKAHGTGLGLALTYRIIENHGGQISVESKVKKGTQFKIVF